MAAINKPQPALPKNSADTEAAQVLRAHVSTGTKAKAPITKSNGSQGAKLAGSKVAGGGKIRGGKA